MVGLLVASIVVGVPAAGSQGVSAGSSQGPRATTTAADHGGTGSVPSATGALGFVGTGNGRLIDRPAGLPATARPAAVARAFVDRYATRLGLAGPGSHARVIATNPGPSGGRSVRLQQTYRGVPVLAGELVLNLDAQGNLRSMNAETSPRPNVATTPRIGSRAAAATAVDAIARETGVRAHDLTAAAPELQIYDPPPHRGAR